jgi:sulfatase maturation enzyme AslB (radical SAM superfamily)
MGFYETIQIILGTKCNLRCKYCYQNEYDFSHTLEIEKVKKALLKLSLSSVVDVEFIGGETLLFNKEIKELMLFMRNHLGLKIHNVDIISNGTLLQPFVDIYSFLQKYVDSISVGVSLDGLKSEMRVDLQGRPIANKVIENVNTITTEYNIPVTIRGTITLNNIDDWIDLVKYFKSNDRVKFKAQYNTYEITSLKVFERLQGKYLGDIVTHSLIKGKSILGGSKAKIPFFLLSKKFRREIMKIDDLKGCGAVVAKSKVAIRYDGKRVACNGDLDGSLLKDVYKYVLFKEKSKCRECEFQTVCSICLVTYKHNEKQFNKLSYYPGCYYTKVVNDVLLTLFYFTTKKEVLNEW